MTSRQAVVYQESETRNKDVSRINVRDYMW